MTGKPWLSLFFQLYFIQSAYELVGDATGHAHHMATCVVREVQNKVTRLRYAKQSYDAKIC